MRARTVVDDLALLRPGELEETLQTLLDLTRYVRPWTSNDMWDLSELSGNLLWVAAKLRRGVLDRMQEKTVTFAERQLAARLHTYFGLTKGDTTRSSVVRSRAFVYLLRNYLPENEYGPFHANGTVNWEHIQAIHHVVSTHLVDLEENEEFEYAIFQMSMPFTQIVIPEGVVLDQEEDWAGVTGSWDVSFCFCDHRELLRFNQASSVDLDTTLFEHPDFREVFRSLAVKLCVTRIEPDPKHPTRPIIYFFGEMHDPSTSTMTGRINMNSENQVQWHFVSGEQANAIWSSEGIQIGGLQSPFGVLGSWSTVFHENDDPVGPFWMRKHKRRSEADLEEE